MSNSPNAPRSLILPHITSIAASRDSINSVAATSIRTNIRKSDNFSCPSLPSSPPLPEYSPRETFPASPTSVASAFSSSSGSATCVPDEENRENHHQVHLHKNISDSKLGIALDFLYS